MTVAAQDAALVRREWGRFVGGFEWDHVATLTFTVNPSEETAERQVRRWVRRLEQRAGRAVNVFHAIERGASGLRHVHALTRGTGALPASALRAAWPCGRSAVNVYDARRGAAAYATKTTADADAVYDLDVRAT